MANLKIIGKGAFGDAHLATDGLLLDEYTVDLAFKIKIADNRLEMGHGKQSNVTIFISNQDHTLITSVSEESSLVLPAYDKYQWSTFHLTKIRQ